MSAEGDRPDEGGESPESPESTSHVADPILLSEETTESSQTWLLPDGSYRAEISAAPVRFRDADGEWQRIDSRLVDSDLAGVAAESAAGEASVWLPQDASERGVRVSAGGAWVSFAMDGLDGAPTVKGATATYEEAGAADGVVYRAFSSGVKESIVLDRAPAATDEALTFRYVLRVSAGLDVRSSEGGSLEVVDGAGTSVFMVPATYMVDSASPRVVSEDVSYEVTRTGERSWALTVAPSRGWLVDSSRVFPVVIDPTVTLSDAESGYLDCWMSQYTPTDRMCRDYNYPNVLKVGVDNSLRRRAMVKFNLDAVPVTAQNVSADLRLYLTQTLPTSNPNAAYRVRRIASGSPFSKYGSWVNRTVDDAWGTAGGDFAGTVPAASGMFAGTSTGFKSIPATTPVQEWLAGASNRGLVVKQEDEDVEQLLVFRSAAYDAANGTGADTGPQLVVTYDDPGTGQSGMGDRGFYQFTAERLTDRMSAKVNVGSGNLLLTAGDVDVAGVAGLDLVFNRYYNSKADPGDSSGDGSGLGPGWSTNVGGSVRLEIANSTTRDTVFYWGPSRYRVRYDENASGAYLRSTPGGAGKLTFDTATSTYKLTGRDKQVQVFDATGRLTAVRDRQDNELTMTYHGSGNGAGKLAQVVDTRGRKAVFSYNSGGLLTEVEVRSASDTVLTRQVYGYTSTTPARLASSEVAYVAPGLLPSPGGDPVNLGAATTYAYDATGRLEYVNDARVESGAAAGGTTKFEYTGSDGQVSALTRLTDDAAIPDSTSTYAYVARGGSLPGSCNGEGNHATTVDGERSDVSDTTTYCLDDHERVRRVIDAKGHVRRATWTAASNVATFDGSGLASGGTGYATSFDSEDNPTQVTTPTGGVASAAYSDSANPHAPTAMSDFDTGGSSTSPTWNYDYDDKGNLIEAKAGVGSGTGDDVTYRYCWDGRGQLQRIDPIDAAGAMSTSLDNDANAGCGTGSQGNDTLFTYNSLGELTGVDAPGAHRTQTMTYDALSRVKTATDGRGVRTTYTYDALGHVVSQTHDDDPNDSITPPTGSATATVSWTYDAAGNRLSVSDPTGAGETFTYDELNRLVTQAQQSPAGSKTYAYDPADNLTSVTVSDEPASTLYTYDAVNLVASVDDQRTGSNVVTFEHDRHDKLLRTVMPMPSGGGVVRQVRYNDAGQVRCVFSHRSTTSALNSLDADTCPTSTATGLLTFHGYDYSKPGTSFKTQNRWAVTEKGNVKTTYDYDPISRLKSATTRNGANTADLRSFTYTYDRHSATTKTVIATPSAMPGLSAGTISAAYDLNDELCWSVSGTSTNGCGSPPSGARVFTHDGAGALTQAGVAGAADPLALVYNVIGQTTSIDPAGSGGAVAMSYSGVTQDRRVTKDSLRMSYGFAGLSSQATNSGVPHAEYFVRTPGGALVAQVDGKDTGSNAKPDVYFVTDAQESVVATIDSTGKVRRYAYEPYGRQIRTWVDPSPYTVSATGLPADGSYNTVTTADDDSAEVQPWRYASGYYDTETGMIKFGTRYYMPEVGRWTQTDPVAGKPVNPITMNPYNYAGSSPAVITDKSGRDWMELVIDGCVYFCVSAGVGGDDDVDISIGGSVGPDIGDSGSILYGPGQNEGEQLVGTCSAAYYLGGVGQATWSRNDGWSGAGGVQIGVGGGCSAGYGYTF